MIPVRAGIGEEKIVKVHRHPPQRADFLDTLHEVDGSEDAALIVSRFRNTEPCSERSAIYPKTPCKKRAAVRKFPITGHDSQSAEN